MLQTHCSSQPDPEKIPAYLSLYTFRYPVHQPSHFVVVKQIATLVQGQEMSVSMAMEQGVTLVLSQG